MVMDVGEIVGVARENGRGPKIIRVPPLPHPDLQALSLAMACMALHIIHYLRNRSTMMPLLSDRNSSATRIPIDQDSPY